MSTASITTAWCRRKCHELLDEVQEQIDFDPYCMRVFALALRSSAFGGAWRPRGVREA